jgi:hypothetical protein
MARPAQATEPEQYLGFEDLSVGTLILLIVREVGAVLGMELAIAALIGRKIMSAAVDTLTPARVTQFDVYMAGSPFQTTITLFNPKKRLLIN